MNVRLIIDTLVRQTMVLIAEVGTSSGMRAPLAHLANQVFLDLVRELERQGVGRRVAADMFGLALRSYQQKVQRLSESATDQGSTLWEAIYGHVRDKEVVHRADLLRRFARDDESMVKSIIKDLVESGLVYQAGRGDASVYRVAPEEDLVAAEGDDQAERLAAIVWLHVYRDGPLSQKDLCDRLNVDAEAAKDALLRLEQDGRAECTRGDGEAPLYSSSRYNIPLEDTVGWEAALLDHHRALVTAMATKLRNGRSQALPTDQLGGRTYSVDIWAGHPRETEVLGLLQRQRREFGALWDEVTAYNDAQSRPPQFRRVTFYFGQSVVEQEGDAE
jgi:Mn-dependent DtxR family transcriptional regulator